MERVKKRLLMDRPDIKIQLFKNVGEIVAPGHLFKSIEKG